MSAHGMMRALWLLGRPCRDFAELISESMDRKLTLGERLAMRFHTLYCTACRRYRQHVHVLRQLIARWLQQAETTGPVMPTEVRKRMEQAIQDAK